MSGRGTEVRQKTQLIGVRIEDDLNAWISSEAAAEGMSKAAFLRTLAEHARSGRRNPTPRQRIEISAQDRALIADFNRHSGRLTGALIQTAKAARENGQSQYRAPVEHLILEVRAVRVVIDGLVRDISK